MREGVAVDKLDCPLEDADEAPHDAEQDRKDDAAVVGGLMLGDGA